MNKIIFVIMMIGVFITACSRGNLPDKNDDSNNVDVESVLVSNVSDSLSQIDGILWQADGDIGVVFSHGAIYDAKSWEDQALALVAENISSFAVEDNSKEQLIAAGKMLKEEKSLNKIILIGASAGGASAIAAVNEDSNLFDKVILLSPVGNPTSIEELPLLVVFSEEEGYESLLASTAINLETLVIAGNAHAQRLFNDDESSKKVMEKILTFIRD